MRKASVIIWFVSIMLSFGMKDIFAADPILIHAMPKSASNYISQKLCRGLGYNNVSIAKLPFIYGRFSTIDEKLLKSFLRKKCLTVDHLDCSDTNIDLLRKYQVKMVVHVRDLRQRAVSLAHHELKLMRNGTIPPGYTKTMTFTELIDRYIRMGEPREKALMIKKWIDEYEKGQIPILITTYEEFRENERLFFEKILDFFGIPSWEYREIAIPKSPQTHFRKGSVDEWREVLTLEQQRQINEQIPDELFSFFGWES